MIKSIELHVHEHGCFVYFDLEMDSRGLHTRHGINSCALPLALYKNPQTGVPDDFRADAEYDLQLPEFTGAVKLQLVRATDGTAWQKPTVFRHVRDERGTKDLTTALKYAPYNEMAIPLFLAHLANKDVAKLNELIKNLTVACV